MFKELGNNDDSLAGICKTRISVQVNSTSRSNNAAMMESEIEKSEKLKANKKAVPGGLPKPQTLMKNWIHQGFLYMDRSEQLFKLLTEACEFLYVAAMLHWLSRNTMSIASIVVVSFIVLYPFSWITNNLFWSIVMFAFPKLRNRGMEQTVQ